MPHARRSGHRATIAALLAAATLLVPGTGAQAAVTGLTIQASLGTCSLFGLNAFGAMTVAVRDGDGRLKGSFAAQVGTNGSWRADCDSITLLPHDRVTLTDTPSGSVLRNLTIPVLTVSVDRAIGRIVGDVTGVSTVVARIYSCPVTDDDCSSGSAIPMFPGTDGRWVLTAAGGLKGWEFVDVAWTSGLDRVEVFARVPRLVVTLGSAKVEGSGNPGGPAISVAATRRGAVVGSTSARVSARRTFKGTLRRGRTAHRLAAGDRIRWSIGRTQQAAFVIPAVRASATTTHISGRCIGGRSVVVRAQAPDGSASFGKAGTAAANGAFDIPWTATAGWRAWAECQTGDGDVIRTKRVTIR